MATKAEPKSEGGEGEAKPKSKKLLIIIIAVVVVLLAGGGGAFWYISKQRAAAAAAAAEDGGEDAAAPAKAATHDAKHPPAYLPMDNIVVNLSDPGGDKVVQIGIVLEVTDAHAAEEVKAYMPTIRGDVIKMLAGRTSTELLTADGKNKLEKDILRKASLPFGGTEEEEAPAADAKKKKKKAAEEFPVVAVHFSSFIVQ